MQTYLQHYDWRRPQGAMLPTPMPKVINKGSFPILSSWLDEVRDPRQAAANVIVKHNGFKAPQRALQRRIADVADGSL